ncbi:MAG TPA: type I-E CRISPR-associated protein Cas6/Cse3/CasE [Rhodanobacteraceae bacterium]
MWDAAATSHEQARDFLFATVFVPNGALVKIRSVNARPRWTPAALPERFRGIIALALETRLSTRGRDVCGRTRRVTIDGARRYLNQHLEAGGISADYDIEVAETGPALVRGRPRWSTFHVAFDGSVSDRAAAERLFADGLGRGRAFGFGMLLARPL